MSHTRSLYHVGFAVPIAHCALGLGAPVDPGSVLVPVDPGKRLEPVALDFGPQSVVVRANCCSHCRHHPLIEIDLIQIDLNDHY